MNRTHVNFDYAFSTPHRLCVCLPQASHKVLYDAYPDHFDLQWSDADTRRFPLGAFMQLPIDWHFSFYAFKDGEKMSGVHWERVEGWIPALTYSFENGNVKVNVTAGAGEKGDVLYVQAENLDKETIHQVDVSGYQPEKCCGQ